MHSNLEEGNGKKSSFDDLLQKYNMYHPGSVNGVDKIKKTQATSNINLNNVNQRPSDQFSRENYYQKETTANSHSDLSDLLEKFGSFGMSKPASHHVIHSKPVYNEPKKIEKKKKFTFDSDVSSDASSDEESVESGFDIPKTAIKSHLKPTRTARHTRLDRYFESINDPIRQHMDKEKEQLMDRQIEVDNVPNQVPVAPRYSKPLEQPKIDLRQPMPELSEYGQVEIVKLPQLSDKSEMESPVQSDSEKRKKKKKKKDKKKSKKKIIKEIEQESTPEQEEVREAVVTPKHSNSSTMVDGIPSESNTLVESPKKKKKKKEKSLKKKTKKLSSSAPASEVFYNPQVPQFPMYASQSPITQWDSASQIGGNTPGYNYMAPIQRVQSFQNMPTVHRPQMAYPQYQQYMHPPYYKKGV